MGPHQLNLILVFFFIFFTLHFTEEFWSDPQIVKTWPSGLSRIALPPQRLHQSGRDIEKSLFNMFKMIPTWGKIYTGFWNERGGKQHRDPFVWNKSEWQLYHPCARQEFEDMHEVCWGGGCHIILAAGAKSNLLSSTCNFSTPRTFLVPQFWKPGVGRLLQRSLGWNICKVPFDTWAQGIENWEFLDVINEPQQKHACHYFACTFCFIHWGVSSTQHPVSYQWVCYFNFHLGC